MVVDPRWTENQAVYWAAMHSANELVPALAKIVESEHWREFIQPRGDIHAYATFASYCSGWLQLSAPAVEALLERSNEKHAARLVAKAIREGVEPTAPNGTNRWANEDRPDSIRPITNPYGTDPNYLLARLKRDHPDLAAEVVEGTISARAAAIQAGILHPRIYVRADDPSAAIRSLLKHYTRTQLLETLAQLPAEEPPNA